FEPDGIYHMGLPPEGTPTTETSEWDRRKCGRKRFDPSNNLESSPENQGTRREKSAAKPQNWKKNGGEEMAGGIGRSGWRQNGGNGCGKTVEISRKECPVA